MPQSCTDAQGFTETLTEGALLRALQEPQDGEGSQQHLGPSGLTIPHRKGPEPGAPQAVRVRVSQPPWDRAAVFDHLHGENFLVSSQNVPRCTLCHDISLCTSKDSCGPVTYLLPKGSYRQPCDLLRRLHQPSSSHVSLPCCASPPPLSEWPLLEGSPSRANTQLVADLHHQRDTVWEGVQPTDLGPWLPQPLPSLLVPSLNRCRRVPSCMG